MRKVIGPDVSFYQDEPSTPNGIDFVRMERAADFVIIRAGQNLWADSDFKDNWRRAEEVGLPRGSYWFFDSRADPKRQAELWVSLLGSDMGELPLFADLEENYGGVFKGWGNWRIFLDRLRTLVGQKEIGIYTAYYYWQVNAPNPVTQPGDLEYFHRYPLWIANYGVEQPLVPKPWSPSEWLFWQFTAKGDGFAYGAESISIDLNYFNGDPQAFARRFGLSVPDEPPPPDTGGKQYLVNAGALNVRQGPGTSFPAVGYVQRNDIVEELESSPDGSWKRVRRLTDGLTGWCSAAYLVLVSVPPPIPDEPPPPPPPPPDNPPEAKYKVTASRLNVREGPGTNFPSIGFLDYNEVVTAIGATADQSWRKIRRSNGLIGWSSSTYLLLVPDVPTPDPNQPPTDENAGEWYRVTTSSVNLRKGAGVSFDSLGFLAANEVVEATGISADRKWIRIKKVSGLTGWVSGDFLVSLGKSPALVTQNVFSGVTYNRREVSSPRRVVTHVLVVDLRTTGIGFLVTPPVRDSFPPLCTRTTSQFLIANRMQIAINGDGFYYLKPEDFPPGKYCASGGDPVRLIGYAASRGKVYSEKASGQPILYINQRNEITFNEPKGKIYNALSGDRMLVSKGKKVSGLDASRFDPRTAIGLNQNSRWLYLVVVDGRELSEGVSFSELADTLISYGAYTGMSLDGGGSSTMVIEGVDGKPRVLNTLIDENIPGRERAVANHLGITLKK